MVGLDRSFSTDVFVPSEEALVFADWPIGGAIKDAGNCARGLGFDSRAGQIGLGGDCELCPGVKPRRRRSLLATRLDAIRRV